MTNIFCDYHHSGLLQSFILLFEQRFGAKVFRPIGRSWFEQGYWKIYDHPATVAQYLDINGATPDGSDPLNQVNGSDWIGADNEVPGGYTHPIYYNCDDIQSGKRNKAITYETFMLTKFDVVIASIPAHIEPFRRLCDSHPSHPKLIYQVGNAWNITPEQERLLDGVMASVNLQSMPSIPCIKYHQEFDLSLFSSESLDVVPPKNITSFVNCFSTDQLFGFDWELFKRIEAQMPDWHFESLGGAGRDGSAHGEAQVAEKMGNSRFVWHTKAGGDGYGHIIHNTAAMSTPTIVRKSYYSGKMADSLLVDSEDDGVTCIVIDGLSDAEIVNKIEWYSDPTRYIQMRHNIIDNFNVHVSFDREAKQIRSFFDHLGVTFV